MFVSFSVLKFSSKNRWLLLVLKLPTFFLDDTDYSESESAQISKQMDGLNIRSPTSVTSETEEESKDGK